jgi:hypothetical protein
MALINCPECGKEISDKAASCPHCGNPIYTKEEEYLCCPKCRSKNIHSQHKGFSGKKALAGAVLTGGIGLLAGTIGSKKIQMTCLQCGHKFHAGDALKVNAGGLNKVLRPTLSPNEPIGGEIEPLDKEELKRIIETEGKIAAVAYIKEKRNLDLLTAKKRVESFIRRNNVAMPAKGGCASMLVLLLVLSSIIATTISVL